MTNTNKNTDQKKDNTVKRRAIFSVHLLKEPKGEIIGTLAKGTIVEGNVFENNREYFKMGDSFIENCYLEEV